MHTPLVPCACCARHVRATDACCPFCDTALPAAAANASVPELPPGLSRAAILVLGASLTLPGCPQHNVPEQPPIAQPYGAPPMPPRFDAAAQPMIVQPYGAPPPPQDAGNPEPSSDAPPERRPGRP